MSATLSHPAIAPAAAPTARAPRLRFGVESGPSDDGSVQWLLKRNCSVAPRQMLWFFASLAALSLAIGSLFWLNGATLVMPFASLEVLALGVALVLYARHATDFEAIRLSPGRLSVEHVSGRGAQRAEFAPAWVRIEPEHGDGSLVELTGQGQRIAVGRFVRPELRRELAEELRWALRRWQGSVRPDKSEN